MFVRVEPTCVPSVAASSRAERELQGPLTGLPLSSSLPYGQLVCEKPEEAQHRRDQIEWNAQVHQGRSLIIDRPGSSPLR